MASALAPHFSLHTALMASSMVLICGSFGSISQEAPNTGLSPPLTASALNTFRNAARTLVSFSFIIFLFQVKPGRRNRRPLAGFQNRFQLAAAARRAGDRSPAQPRACRRYG